MEKCEFCNGEVDYTATNSFHGGYCQDCLNLEIEQAKEALQSIKEQRRSRKQPKRKKKESLEELRAAAEKALRDLSNGQVGLPEEEWK